LADRAEEEFFAEQKVSSCQVRVVLWPVPERRQRREQRLGQHLFIHRHPKSASCHSRDYRTQHPATVSTSVQSLSHGPAIFAFATKGQVRQSRVLTYVCQSHQSTRFAPQGIQNDISHFEDRSRLGRSTRNQSIVCHRRIWFPQERSFSYRSRHHRQKTILVCLNTRNERTSVALVHCETIFQLRKVFYLFRRECECELLNGGGGGM